MRLAVVLFLCTLGCAVAAPSADPPKLRLGGNVRPSRYAVDLTIVPNHDTFNGVVDIHVEIQTPSTSLWLNATALEIKDASFRSDSGTQAGRVVPGGNDFAGLAFDRPVTGRGVLHISYEGKISRNSSAGLFQMKDGDQWYVYSQFEPTDARRAFPCFDEPGFKTPWQLTLHVPKDNVALANTPSLSETNEADNMKAVKFKESAPLPSYLVALAVGRFDVVDAGKVGKTPLRVITPRGKAAEAKSAAEAIPQLLKLLENYFGTPFPYEKLDSVVMPISNFAMENVGLITYGSTLLLAKPGEDSINRQREMATVAAHEMAHQWFGDLVTTAWWNDIWLNEAFATWMERKIVSQWKPDWHEDVSAVGASLGAMRDDSLISARKIRQPIDSNDDIANAFDGITYEKGAAVIQMFETSIGKEKFRKGIQLYLKQHANGNATASDFETAISSAAGSNIAPAFDSFLDQAGVPELSVDLDCTSKPKLKLAQKRLLPIGSKGSAQQIWRIPVCVAYESDGSTHHQCEMFADPRTEMVLTDAKSCPTWILANDGESGYYQVAYTEALLEKTLVNKGGHLSLPERVGVLGNVDALIGTGDISPRIALRLAQEFSDDPNRQVVSMAAGIAGMVKGNDVPDELRPKGAAFVRKVFGQRAMELGWTGKAGESEDTRLLRQRIVPFVAGTGEQKELIDDASKLTRTWLETHNGIAPEMVGSVLRVAAEFGNQDLFDRLNQAVLKEKDQRTRQRLLGALGAFRDPKIARQGMELFLSNDFDPRESFFALVFGPLAYPETRDLPFQFVKENLDKLLARLPREVGGDYAANFPAVGGAFCDASRRAEIQTFFQDRVKAYTGGPRNLAQVLEGIDLCIAERKKLAPELDAFLKSY
jgi:cytosol alanyl aminopeptidase